jgi:hypothetical protein
MELEGSIVVSNPLDYLELEKIRLLHCSLFDLGVAFNRKLLPTKSYCESKI